jgi:hypothetical protein
MTVLSGGSSTFCQVEQAVSVISAMSNTGSRSVMTAIPLFWIAGC